MYTRRMRSGDETRSGHETIIAQATDKDAVYNRATVATVVWLV